MKRLLKSEARLKAEKLIEDIKRFSAYEDSARDSRDELTGKENGRKDGGLWGGARLTTKRVGFNSARRFQRLTELKNLNKMYKLFSDARMEEIENY